MDLHSLWQEDPEELLLDLGFGADGADLRGRIPARFLTHPSQARGMSLHVFLEAQKSRLDLEHPDVSSKCPLQREPTASQKVCSGGPGVQTLSADSF